MDALQKRFNDLGKGDWLSSWVSLSSPELCCTAGLTRERMTVREQEDRLEALQQRKHDTDPWNVSWLVVLTFFFHPKLIELDRLISFPGQCVAELFRLGWFGHFATLFQNVWNHRTGRALYGWKLIENISPQDVFFQAMELQRQYAQARVKLQWCRGVPLAVFRCHSKATTLVNTKNCDIFMIENQVSLGKQPKAASSCSCSRKKTEPQHARNV